MFNYLVRLLRFIQKFTGDRKQMSIKVELKLFY